MQKTRPGKAVRRRQIFDAALEAFSMMGFERTSMDAIAAKLKITKPALYLYFKNKDDLFFSMIFDVFDKAIKDIKQLLATPVSGKEKLRLFIYRNFEFLLNNVDIFKLAQPAGEKHRHLFEKKLIAKSMEIFRLLGEIIKQCRSEGLIVDGDVGFQISALNGIISGVFSSGLMMKSIKPNIGKMTKKTLAFFIKGAGGKI